MVLVLLVLASISLWPDRRIAANCLHSDAPDYILPALNFLQGKGFVIMVEGHKYPPQHVFGLSLLMAPAYAVFGRYVGNGIYSIFVLGLGTVMVAYWLAKRLFDRRVAFVACLFLILADEFRWYSRIIASDGAASAIFCLAAHLLLLKVLQNPRSSLWVWLALGQVAGYGMVVRPDNIFIVLPIGIFLLAAFRKREVGWGGIVLASSGVVFWLAVVLWANFLYTGDCLRSMYHVIGSQVYDRVGGSTSWRYLLNPSFEKSNLGQMLEGAVYQWSYFGGDVDRAKKYFYLVANLFLAVGLVRVVTGFKKDRRDFHFLVWLLLWACPMMLFFSCSFNILGIRVMQRVVPYLCILDGVGLVALWDRMTRFRVPFDTLLDRLGTRIDGRIRSGVALLPMLSLFGGAMVAWGGYVFLHPYVDPLAWVPISAYMEHVSRLIPENDAVIISTCNPFYAEHFLVTNTARMLVPLHRLTSGADFFVQWKKPPHPEWINADLPNRSDQGLSVVYERMRENGARFIFPYAALDYPEILGGALHTGPNGRSLLPQKLVFADVIQRALHAGRKVYFVGQGINTKIDSMMLARLSNLADLQVVEGGFEPSYEIPTQYREFLRTFFVLQVSAMNSLDSRLRFTSTGEVRMEGRETGPVELKQVEPPNLRH